MEYTKMTDENEMRFRTIETRLDKIENAFNFILKALNNAEDCDGCHVYFGDNNIPENINEIYMPNNEENDD